MGATIRKSDLPLLAAAIPLAHSIPATLITNSPRYVELVSRVPDWFLWISVGFSVAAWLLDPWRSQSRVKELLHWLTDHFTLEHLVDKI